jgi:hypothetical protein
MLTPTDPKNHRSEAGKTPNLLDKFRAARPAIPTKRAPTSAI